MTTQTEKRLARKAEREPRYIIVDDPAKPTKYWRYRSWSDSRADAHVFTHYQRDWWPTLPDGGVWLLVDEEVQAKVEKDSSTPSSELPDTAELSHTPTPWEVAKGSNGSIFTMGDPYGHQQMHVADVRGWGHLTGVGACNLDPKDAVKIQDDNAAFIVLACNSYDASQQLISEMVEALKFYADPRKYEGPNHEPDSDEETVAGCYRLDVTRDGGTKARAAIKAAEGK